LIEVSHEKKDTMYILPAFVTSCLRSRHHPPSKIIEFNDSKPATGLTHSLIEVK